jgi:hypothetical protein
MGKFVLGLLLGVASLAFAADAGSINPICSMVEALSNNWGVIKLLVILILGVMVMGVGIINLTAGKAANALVVVIGGAVLLIATYKLVDTAGGQLNSLAGSCQGSVQSGPR